MVLNTPEYNHMLAGLLEDEAYRKLRRILLIPWNPRHFSFLRWSANNSGKIRGPLTLYGLSKTHKQGVPLRSTVNTTEAPRYCLSKRLAGLLSSHAVNSKNHVKNQADFARTLGSLRAEAQGKRSTSLWCHSSPGCRSGG